MVIVRKAHTGELEKIIKVANASFVPVRYEGFDFKERMPKIYAANKDYSDIHFVVEDEEGIKSVAGNLIKKLTLGNKEYTYSIVGTVSTLPSESNKGYMALMMNEIEKENVEREVVFSMLTGKRQRYNRYGYERSGSRIVYEVTSHYYKHNDIKGDLLIRKFENSDLDSIYQIYLDNQPILVREKEEFILDLRISNSTIYTILEDNLIIGYFAIGDSVKVIHELSIKDLSKAALVMKEVLNVLNKDSIQVLINPLNNKLLKTFDLFAESKNVEDEIMWKVYKWIPFIEMCMQLNSKKIANITATEIYKVGERVLEISVKNGNYKILETNKKYSQEFSELEFVRFIIGNNSSYHYFSNIFPLALDFNEGDMF